MVSLPEMQEMLKFNLFHEEQPFVTTIVTFDIAAVAATNRRRSNVVKEVDKIKKNREERRAKQAEQAQQRVNVRLLLHSVIGFPLK